VDDPLNDYLSWEMAAAEVVNIPAGEDIRVLPEHRPARASLPDHDFWMADGQVLRMVFGPNGFDHVVQVTDPSDLADHERWREVAWNNSQEWHGNPQHE
jgi:hypothetical protein